MIHCTVCGSPDARICSCNQEEIGKVGTELRSIIPRYLKTKSCKCEDIAAWMDRIGISGVQKNREKIIEHLVAQAKKLSVGMAPRSLTEKVASKWLDQAIEQAESKMQAS